MCPLEDKFCYKWHVETCGFVVSWFHIVALKSWDKIPSFAKKNSTGSPKRGPFQSSIENLMQALAVYMQTEVTFFA